MSENKVDIKIAGRIYPLSVENSEETKKAFATAKELEKEINQLTGSYKGSKDKQDILAMLVFKYKALLLEKEDKLPNNQVNTSNNQLEVLHKIEALLDTVDVS